MHHLGFGLLRFCSASRRARAVRRWLAPRDPVLEVRALGRTFDAPLGLAAGFDKDAVGYEQLYALGFGFIEVGTLTALAQPGNPRPRMFRLVRHRALVNRLGFNNRGSAGALPRLAHPRVATVAVNIGKSKVVPEAEAIADYVISAERLGAYADYVVVKVSSPNTPGLRDLQAVAVLGPLLAAVRQSSTQSRPRARVPLLVRSRPTWPTKTSTRWRTRRLARARRHHRTNTTSAAPRSRHDELAKGAGGLSGAPLGAALRAVLERLYARVGQKLVLIGVGASPRGGRARSQSSPAPPWSRPTTGSSTADPCGRAPAPTARQLRAARGFANVQDAGASRGRRVQPRLDAGAETALRISR